MNPAVSSHPGPEHLKAFVLGKLPETEMLAVHGHLEKCPACAELVTRVREDTFMRKLQGGEAPPPPPAAISPELAQGSTLHSRVSDATAAWQVNSATLPPGNAPVPPAARPAPIGPPAAAKPTAPPPPAPVAPAPPKVAPAAQPPAPSGAVAGVPNIPGLEMQKVLGKGGMGVVYLVKQTDLKRLAALKVLKKGDVAGGTGLARFKTEAETIARLQHDNIVQIYQVGTHEDTPYLLLEYIEGGTLAQKIAQGLLPPRQAAAICMTLAQAVQYAHDKGVIHRDLKPANVLLNQFGKPKINDFGLAKHQADFANLTQTQAILGTPSYMAPEQASGGSRDITPRADVYALGAILYEMLTGRPPFKGESPMLTLRMVVRHDPIQPRALEPGIPPDLEAICLKCLEKSPANRYASAQALGEDLKRFLGGEPVQARPARWWERGIKWAKRRPALAGLMGVSVLAFAVLIFALTRTMYSRRLEEALDDANKQKEVAEQERNHAREQKARATYLAGLYAAHESVELGTASFVFDFLKQTTPKEGDKDFRGFEWYYLWRLCSREQETLRHAAPVKAVAVSPGNTFMATGAGDHLVRLWDLSKRTEVYVFRGHKGAVRAVAFSANGKLLASASDDGTVRLWDVDKREHVRELSGHEGGATACLFDPKGKWLATGSAKGTLRVYPMGEDAPRILAKLPLAVTALTVSPGGDYLATNGSSKHDVLFWAMPEGKEATPLEGHKNVVHALAFAPQGTLFASGSDDGEVILWDLKSEERIKTFNLHRGPVHSLVFNPAGTYLDEGKLNPADALVSGSFDHSVRVWKPGVKGWGQNAFILGHTGQVSAVGLSTDGKVLISGSYDQTVKIWDMDNIQTPHTLLAHKGDMKAVAFGGDSFVYTAGGDGTVAQQRIEDARGIIFKTPFFNKLTAMAVRRSDNTLILGGEGRTAPGELFTMDIGRRLHTPLGTQNGVITALALTTDGKLLAAAGQDRTIRLWDLERRKDVDTLAEHFEQIHALAFSPDGKRLASAGQGDQVLIWNMETKTKETELKGFSGLVRALAFSPDGKSLVIGGENTTTHQCPVQVWNLESNKLTSLLKGHTGIVNALAFSPDGKQLATGSHDQTVKLWDWETGEERATYKEHLSPIRAVAFAPDGRSLLSGDEDGTLVTRRGATDADVRRKRD